MKAMILAAGEGTRLRPLTLSVPKPMIPIVDKPLLAWTLDWLAGEGVTDVVINLYHRPQSIPDTFGQTYAGLQIHYCYEDTLRGTSGGVKGAAAILRGAPFFVIYGDNLVHADLRRLETIHRAQGGVATVALFAHPNPTAAGIVGLDETGRITRFVEKPAPDQIFSDQANAGVYVLEPSVLDSIPADGPSDFGREIFPQLLAQGKALYGTPLGGYIQDTGTPDSYRQANWDALQGCAGRTFGSPALFSNAGARVSSGAMLRGRNVLGSGVQVGEGALLTDCLLWEGASVGPGAQLERAILGQGAQVAAGAQVPAGMLLEAGAQFPDPVSNVGTMPL